MRGPGRAILAALLPIAVALQAAPSAAHPQPARTAYLFMLPPMSYEEAAASPPLAELAAAGGIGLMTTAPAEDRSREDTLVDGGAEPGTLERLAAGGEGRLTVDLDATAEDVGRLFVELDGSEAAEEVLIVAAAASPSAEMEERGDAVTPVLVAAGAPEGLADSAGPRQGLTSRTTRRPGVVANLDVAPTILAFLGVSPPPAMAGSPVRVEGAAPDHLHQRYLEVRALRIPVQVGTLILALVLLLGAAGFLLRGGRSPAVAGVLGVGGLVAVALPAAFLPAGDLPRIEWWTAVPTAAVIASLIVLAALRLGHRDATLPVAVVAAASASIVMLDAVLGWRGSMLPLFGGTPLEGARFFGLGNLSAGIVLAGAILTAAHLPPWGGVALLAGAALFAGLPWIGSNLGASFTLFAAAGLWWALRVRRRLGWREVVAAVGAAALGTAAVVAAHALFAEGETHVARLTEEAGRSGLPAVLEAAGRRLAIAARVTSQVPPAWLLLLALPALGVVAWRRWDYLARDPAWRDAVVTLSVAGLVGFLANDTGLALGGLAFAFAAAAIGYPVLEERWRSG